jgi:hypothetical protein
VNAFLVIVSRLQLALQFERHVELGFKKQTFPGAKMQNGVPSLSTFHNHARISHHKDSRSATLP